MNQKTLKKVIIVARHGPRAPIRQLSKLDQSFWKNLKTTDKNEIAVLAELTEKGRVFCREFGKKIKNDYHNKLNLNSDNVSFYSSKISRTQDSAILVADELCNKKLEITDLKFHESISADPDILFKNNKFNEFRKLTTSIEIDKEHHSTSEFLKKFINNHVGEIRTNNHFFDIRGTLECYCFEKIELPKIITSEILEDIEKCALSYYKNLFSHESLHYVGKNIHNFALHLLKYDPHKLVYLSTHDTIIFPLSQHINSEHLQLPKFCSNVKYELFSDDSIDIYYDDVIIKTHHMNNIN